MFEGEANRKKPHSFQKKKKKSQNSNDNSSPTGNDGNNKNNFSVTATTSKSRTPIPPNQPKKINNKKAAKKKREKLLETNNMNNTATSNNEKIELVCRNSNDTPLSTTSESSTARTLLNNLELEGDSDSGSNSSEYDENYQELPCDTLILNTENVDKIIEQIETDIESEADENDSCDSSDEFGEEEALNAGVQRYFIENSGPKCFNCGECGHVVRDCPSTSTVPCNLCGQLGHSRSNCPQEVCYNCSRPGHQSKACPAKRKRRAYDDDLCNRCGQPGHLSRECSMAWRGYVFARDLPRSHSAFLDELRGLRKRCYNCASISHFGDDCPNRRRPNYSVFHIPNYDYLDRIILRIKASKFSSSQSIGGSVSVAKSEPNAKQKQADNFKKIVQPTQSNKKNVVDHHQPPKQTLKHKGFDHSEDVEIHNVDDYSNSTINHRNVHYPHNNQAIDHQHDNVNRKVFLQSRGVDSDEIREGERQVIHHNNNNNISKKKNNPVPFVSYEGNQVRVKEYDGNEDGEDNFKKGSSKKFNSKNGPSYRGGYK